MQNRRHGPRWWSSRTVKLFAATVAAAIAVAYPIWRGFMVPTPDIDFRFYWLAGHMWVHQLDPYSSQFVTLGKDILPPHSSWLYPPPWWPICMALGAFEFPVALNIWRAAAPAILLASTGVVIGLLSRELPKNDRILVLASACAMAASMESTGNVLVGGQVSPVLVYAGIALIACATITDRKALLVAGLVLVALKPQVGAVVFLGFIFTPEHRRAVAIAILALLALSLPQLVQFGTQTTIVELLANMRNWDRITGNAPLGVTGLKHLLARVDLILPTIACYLFAAVCACCAGFMFRRNRWSLQALGLLIAGLAAFLPLHNYDLTILVLLAAILIATDASITARSMILCALLVTFRPSRMEALFDVPIFGAASGGNISYSAASLVLLAIAVRGALAADPAAGVEGDGDRDGLSAAMAGRST